MLFGCTDTDEVTTSNKVSDRYEVLASTSPSQTFDALTPQNKSLIWQDKLNRLLAMSLPGDVEFEVVRVIDELRRQQTHREHKMTQELRAATKSLLMLVPEHDFVEMFVLLDDYEWNGKFKGTTYCADCVDKLDVSDTPKFTLKKDDGKDDPISTDKPCDCNWACDWYVTVNGGDSCKGCEPTESGCGPFGTSGCYRDYEPGGC